MSTTGKLTALGRAMRPRAVSPRTGIWLLTGAIAAAAATMLVTIAPAGALVQAPVELPWLVLVLAFALAELAVVHVQVDRDSHSFSLTELALVVGLYLSDPVPLVLAQVVGAGIVFVARRRQSAAKLAFNLALYALAGCLATISFAALVGEADPVGPRGWVAALVAVLVATTVSDLAIFAAISIVEGRIHPGRLPEMMGLSVPFALGTAAVALVAIRNLWTDPLSLLLLAVPSVLILGSYRAFCRARRERANIEFLHQVGTLLSRGGDLEPALAELLTASRATFRSGAAELVLIGPGGETTTTRSDDGSADAPPTVGPDDDTHGELLRQLEITTVVRTGSGSDRVKGIVDRYARARGLNDMMAAAVTGDRVHGILIVANRHGDVTTFDEADAALFNTLAGQVGQILDNGHLEQSLRQVTVLKEELAHRARHDPLTGLASRADFLERTQHAIDTSGPGLTVLYLDLDGFKAVNDSLGHDAGDVLLRVVASRLRGCVRATDPVARLGGDEFAVLLQPDDGEPEAVVATAERIRARVSEPVEIAGRLVTVGPSIGIASTAAGTMTVTVDELVQRADAAMYSAKRAGGHRHAFYTATLDQVAQVTYSAADLAAAMDDEQIVVHYQPIVDLSTGAIVGAEALVRWQHPTDGILAPALFVPLAEQTGLIQRLGNMVLEQACRDARDWPGGQGGDGVFLSVNLSAAQLADPDLVGRVRAATTGAGWPATSLVLEITETMLMRDPHSAAIALATLHGLGVQIAVDDFGTGYSSLAYLRRFPVDILKIATEFTHGLGTNPDDDVVTHAIIRLAETLGLRTVAEGIETAAQHDDLRALDCALGQGYLFSRPVAGDRMRELLAAGPQTGSRLAAASLA